jgi:hypothetical protein
MNSKRLMQIQSFCLLSGIMLLFVFGSMILIIHFELEKQKEIHNKLISENTMDFVLLERPQKKRFFHHTHYYYSYSGQFRGILFSRFEKVDSDYFHISSPGKNVETRIYVDSSGNLHTLLRGNKILYGKKFSGLYIISLVIAILGTCFIITGVAIRIYSGTFT